MWLSARRPYLAPTRLHDTDAWLCLQSAPRARGRCYPTYSKPIANRSACNTATHTRATYNLSFVFISHISHNGTRHGK